MLTEQDIALRSQGIGSSEIAVILGIAPPSHGTQFDVWMRKTGRAKKQDRPQFAFGHLMESGVIMPLYKQYLSEAGKRWTVRNLPTRRHVTLQHVIDSVDGVVYDEQNSVIACVEAKTVHYSKRHHWGEPGTDKIPDYYYAQCLWHMAVHNAPFCDVPVMFAGDFEISLYRVKYNAELFATMADTAKEWWVKYVDGNRAPPLDDSDAAMQYIAQRYPKPEKQIAPATPLAYVVRDNLSKALKNKKELDEQIARMKNELRGLIADAGAIEFDDGERVTWTRKVDEKGDVVSQRLNLPSHWSEISQHSA